MTIDTTTIGNYNDLNNMSGVGVLNPVISAPSTISNINSYGNTISCCNGSSNSIQPVLASNVVLGDSSSTKKKLYITEIWQTKNPIRIDDNLIVSLEKDLISNDEIKTKILSIIENEHPDVYLQLGLDNKNIKLVKNEVTLEIRS
jgi:hypothetical protein